MQKVLIVDDHPLMRDALAWTISEEADFQVIGQAADGKEALEMCIQLQPDLVLLDIYMPVMDGIEFIRHVRAEKLPMRFIILTSSMEKDIIVSTMHVKPDGFLQKNTPRAQILEAIRAVSQGKKYIHPDIAVFLADHIEFETQPIRSLSRRENEVLELIQQSYSNREIADHLVISISTVRVHVNNIMEKLNLANRRQIVQYQGNSDDDSAPDQES